MIIIPNDVPLEETRLTPEFERLAAAMGSATEAQPHCDMDVTVIYDAMDEANRSKDALERNIERPIFDGSPPVIFTAEELLFIHGLFVTRTKFSGPPLVGFVMTIDTGYPTAPNSRLMNEYPSGLWLKLSLNELLKVQINVSSAGTKLYKVAS